MTTARDVKWPRAATAPLFSAFNGFAPGPDVVEDLTNELLLRRS
jgi:hypothetical protein